MNISEIIKEHSKGCTDTSGVSPYDCIQCTKGMISAIEKQYLELQTELDKEREFRIMYEQSLIAVSKLVAGFNGDL